MLHRRRVAKALYYAFRRRLRLAIGVAARPQAPVLAQPLDHVVGRHSLILNQLTRHLPDALDLRGMHVCEIGPGDCLATAAFCLAKGARHVDLVEVQPPVVNAKQVQVLEILKGQGYPVDQSLIQINPDIGEFALDTRRVTYHRCYLENLQAKASHDLIFSSFVLEHVEDLAGFYANCWNTLQPGGHMLHLIDLGGHGLWEDPLPPLDFQTYPDWLFEAMSPKYDRATRRFLSEHLQAATSSGFTIQRVTPIRAVEDSYLDQLWPKLRPLAQRQPRDELRVIEFALLAKK